MPNLGLSTDGGGTFSANAGRKVAGKFTLATTQKLTELHAWVGQGSSTANSFIIHIHADSAGSPGARIAYTNPITPALGSDPIEISQSGFNNVLAPGDYWLGVSYQGSSGTLKVATSGGILKSFLGGATFNPPSDPFGATDFSNSNNVSVWAVVLAPVYTYSAYSHSGDTIARTFNAYSFTGDTKADRYKGGSPSDLAKKAWVYPSYTGGSGGGVSGGGGISIFTKP